jgi:hypothetical protein
MTPVTLSRVSGKEKNDSCDWERKQQVTQVTGFAVTAASAPFILSV